MKKKDFEKLVNNLKTQDNRITGDPLFCVETKKRTWGADSEYHDGKYQWVNCDEFDTVGSDEDLKEYLLDNGDEFIEEMKGRSEFKGFDFPEELDSDSLDNLLSFAGIDLHYDSEIDLGYYKFRKCYYVDHYQFVTAHLTEAAALEYIDDNRHHMKEPRTYVTSQYRCYEWNALREALMSGQLVLKEG